MGTKTASLTLEGDGLRFAARAGSGHTVILDDSAGDSGVRPAELVPMALAGCTAFDVISILRKKRQDVTAYAVSASGEQMEDSPHAFTRIDVVHEVTGRGIDVEAVRRAIELSATKYCSVGGTLSTGITAVHHGYVVHDETGADWSGEVVVTGPLEDPATLGTHGAAIAVTTR